MDPILAFAKNSGTLGIATQGSDFASSCFDLCREGNNFYEVDSAPN
jgi:hypothetical protein